jgi:hypothetical protein
VDLSLGRGWSYCLAADMRRLKRDLLTTKPAGVIRNEEVDSVVRCSLEPHRSFTPLMSKLRPVAVDSAEPVSDPGVPGMQPQMAWSLSSRPDVQRITFGIGEAADRLGVSKTTLWSLVRRDWAAAG